MFNEDNTIEEKIKIMKQESKFYSIETLHQLHKVINKPIDINNDSTIPNVFDKLEGIIYQLTLQEDNNIPKELLDNLLNLLKDKEEVLVKDTQNMRNIKNYLIVNNSKLKISIKEFISKNSRNSKKTSKEIDLFFNLIEKNLFC